MADPALLALLGNDDLSQFSQSIQANDPNLMFQQALGAYQPDTSNFGAGASFANSFGKAFLSGYLGNRAKENVRSQLSSVASVLPQLTSDPLNTMAPEGVDSDAFQNLKISSALKQMYNKQKREETFQDLFQKAGFAGLTKKAEIMGENEAYGLGSGDKNPKSPIYQANKDIQKIEDDARNEILTGAKYPSVSKFRNTTTALNQLKNIKDLDSKSSDIPFATLLIGGLDGSVVKEGEYNRVSGANPFLQKYSNLLGSVLDGKSELGVNIKKQMFDELALTQKGLLPAALKEAAPVLETVKSRGGDTKNVFSLDDSSLLTPKTTEPVIPEGAVPTGQFSGGKPVYNVGGRLWVPD